MSAATASLSRDPRARYEGGFDRWSRESRQGWTLVCREAAQRTLALGEGESVWSWDNAARIWERVDGQTTAGILRDHAHAMRRLRRAVLVVKLLDSRIDGERDAAKLALQRIGAGILADWQLNTRDSTAGAHGWMDHPASVYLAVTHDCRAHMAERERMPFDPGLYAWLVAAAQEDFRTGRRSQPPRLRPDDLVHLQVNLAQPNGALSDPDNAEPDVPDAFTTHASRDPAEEAKHEAEGEHIARLREALAQSMDAEIETEQRIQQRRRRVWLVSSSAAVILAATVAGTVLF